MRRAVLHDLIIACEDDALPQLPKLARVIGSR